MKKLILIVVLAAAGYAGYTIWQKHQAAPSDTVAETEPPVPAPNPSSEAPPPPPPPLPPLPLSSPLPTPASQPRLAPAGTYFLLQRVSLVTDSGVGGISPGTRVTLVKAGPPMIVTDGEHEVEVSAAQLTNDLDVAARLSQADTAAQAAVKSTLAGQHAKKAQEAQKSPEAPASQSTSAAQNPPQQPPAASNGSSLNSGAYNKTTDNKHVDERGRVYWLDIYGRRHY